MSDGLFGIGTSGLLAYQRSLATTGHNIANVGTEGYSRQRVELNARTPQFAGNGYLGTGVQTGATTRLADQFVESQLRTATSASAQYSTFFDLARQVESVLADPEAGLSPGLQRLFAAAQDVANDPTSIPARQVFLSEADSLVDRFGFLSQQLAGQRDGLNGQIQTTVSEINSLAAAMGDLNRDIVSALGRSGGAPPNDLLDQRDQLVRELAERVNVTAVEQDNGALNIFIGNGQSLVIGDRAATLVAAPLGEDPGRIDVGFSTGGSAVVDVGRFLTGGKLGALLDFRANVLDTAQNALGRTALALAQGFNDQQALGQDLDGLPGVDLFRVPEPTVRAGASNATTGLPDVGITELGKLTTDDYRLRFNGSIWELRRASDQQVIADPGDVGLSIDTSALGGAAVGDSFLIQPTANVAQQIETLTSDPRRVAAASLVRASIDVDNAGDATVRSVRALDASDPDLQSPVSVSFDAGASEFQVGAVSVPLDPSGVTEIQYNGWSLVIEGVPADGDTFLVGPNNGGVGDNANALALAGLQDARVLVGGTTSLEGSYNALLGEIGTRTRQAEVASQSQSRLLDAAWARRESVSGVNLDEEAANLLRFQQAYQASAQVIAVTSTLFDTLLGAVRR
jgi:flagellar hook-associated protein 1